MRVGARVVQQRTLVRSVDSIVLIREFVSLVIAESCGHMWSDTDAHGQEDDLGLDRPAVIVEPDVRSAVRDYFRSMGLTSGGKTRRRIRKGSRRSPQDTTKKTLWREIDRTPKKPRV